MRLPIPRTARLAPVLVAVSLSAGLGGCGHPVERKLDGRWLGESVESFDDPAVAAATGWAKGTSLEFAGSTLTVSIPAEEPRTGEYKVLKVYKNDVQIAVTRKDGSVDNAKFTLDDDRSMRWRLSGGRSIVMRRQD